MPRLKVLVMAWLTTAQLILDHLKEMFSVIYTPTEGEAIADYSKIFRRPEGCFLNIDDADRVEDDIKQWGNPEDIDLIVVSDGQQILGIGDQGVGAILISVAKLVIYTLCAGIHPSRTLPVVLDCGTDVSRDTLTQWRVLTIVEQRSHQRRAIPGHAKRAGVWREIR